MFFFRNTKIFVFHFTCNVHICVCQPSDCVYTYTDKYAFWSILCTGYLNICLYSILYTYRSICSAYNDLDVAMGDVCVNMNTTTTTSTIIFFFLFLMFSAISAVDNMVLRKCLFINMEIVFDEASPPRRRRHQRECILCK